MTHKLATILLTLTLSLITSICAAQSISLYDQPKSDAKIVGSIDPAKGIVPIFTPKEGGWVKVGNPTDGNVGWVKTSDLMKAAGTSNGFSFSQKLESTGSGPDRYIFQFGVPVMTKEQTDALYKQIQAQQAVIQQGMQKAFQGLFVNTDKTGEDIGFPLFVPVIAVPEKAPSATPAQPAPTANPKK